MLSAHGIGVQLGGHAVLEGVDLNVARGSWSTIIGPNGAGKTTLLRAILGLIDHAGTVLIGGEGLSARARARAVGYVPQRPERPPGMTVSDYVMLGRTPHLGYFGRESDCDVIASREAITVMDLRDLAHRDVASLSGGESQRVALARAVAQEANLLVLDEPTTGLDIGRQQEVMTMIDGLRRARGLTILSTMHDLTLAAQFSDEVTLLSRGVVVDRGAASAVLTPASILEHYGADVAVVTDEDGHLQVVPRRLRPGLEERTRE